MSTFMFQRMHVHGILMIEIVCFSPNVCINSWMIVPEKLQPSPIETFWLPVSAYLFPTLDEHLKKVADKVGKDTRVSIIYIYICFMLECYICIIEIIVEVLALLIACYNKHKQQQASYYFQKSSMESNKHSFTNKIQVWKIYYKISVSETSYSENNIPTWLTEMPYDAHVRDILGNTADLYNCQITKYNMQRCRF